MIARKRKNIFIMIAVLLVLALLGHISGVMWMRNLMVIVAILTTVNYFVLRPVTFKFQETFLPAMEKFYDNFIRFSLQGKNLFSFGWYFWFTDIFHTTFRNS